MSERFLGMYLTLVNTTGKELARAELLRADYDENDVQAMAALGRKLVAWVKDTQEQER